MWAASVPFLAVGDTGLAADAGVEVDHQTRVSALSYQGGRSFRRLPGLRKLAPQSNRDSQDAVHAPGRVWYFGSNIGSVSALLIRFRLGDA